MCPVCFQKRGMATHGWRFCARRNRRWSSNVGDRRIATGISKIWKLRTCAPLPSGLCLEASKPT